MLEKMIRSLYEMLQALPYATPFGFGEWTWNQLSAIFYGLPSYCGGSGQFRGVYEDSIGQYIIVYFLNVTYWILSNGAEWPLLPFPCV